MHYQDLAELYATLEDTPKRLLKTKALSEVLAQTPSADIAHFVLLLRGTIFPPWSEEKIGVASKLVMKAIALATGRTATDVEKTWKKTGDLGETAEQLLHKKKQATLQSSTLSLKKVFDNLTKVAQASGQGSVDRKIKLIAELLTSASALEGKYIVRTVLEDLRVGVGEGSLRDAIVWAFFGKELGITLDEKKLKLSFEHSSREQYTKTVEIVQTAYDLCNDFAQVAEVAKTKGKQGLQNIHLHVGAPIKVMLFQKAKNMEDAFKTVGTPAAVEYKYDGFRMQIHKKGKDVTIYTRRLENVTTQFPDVAERIQEHVHAKEVILDCEAAGYDPQTKKYLPFQNISQRIKRKYDITDMAKKFPVEVNVFDVIEYNGKNMLSASFEERRAIIEKIVDAKKQSIMPAKQLITDNVAQATAFYEKALAAGNEGVMVKSMSAVYKPGSRVGYGVKVKPTMENLDLVIVGAEWGTGKRKGWLTSFTLACQDEDGNFVSIGKVGTGFKEKEDMKGEHGVTFEEMTTALQKHITSERGREVTLKPKVIIEIAYEEIQKSPSYESGYALRFPRIIRLREDKHLDEVAELSEVEDLYYGQGR